MKEYSTSQMIAELEKNPKLRFKEVEGEFGETLYCEVSEYGYIRLTTSDNESQDFSGNIMPSAKWTRVRTPVTWQEAIQAWCEGKKIIWIVNGVCDVAEDFQTGVWYIKDE